MFLFYSDSPTNNEITTNNVTLQIEGDKGTYLVAVVEMIDFSQSKHFESKHSKVEDQHIYTIHNNADAPTAI